MLIGFSEKNTSSIVIPGGNVAINWNRIGWPIVRTDGRTLSMGRFRPFRSYLTQKSTDRPSAGRSNKTIVKLNVQVNTWDFQASVAATLGDSVGRDVVSTSSHCPTKPETFQLIEVTFWCDHMDKAEASGSSAWALSRRRSSASISYPMDLNWSASTSFFWLKWSMSSIDVCWQWLRLNLT